MKKGKLLFTAAVGLAAFGLLFTACNNEDATAKKSENAVKVTDPVESEADVTEVVTDVLQEYADFFAQVSAPSSRSAAKTGAAAGEQLADFTTALLDFATSNGLDVAKLVTGYSTGKDISFKKDIDLADLTPSELFETVYTYTAKLTNMTTTYDEFVKQYELADAQSLVETLDDYIALSKVKLGIDASYVAESKKVSASVDTSEGVRFSNIDNLIKTLIESVGYTIPSDVKVPEGLKYLSLSNDGSATIGYTAGSALIPAKVDESVVSLKDDGELRFNLITDEGKGGYFIITPSVNCSLKDATEGKANATLNLSVSNGKKVTFSQDYTTDQIKAFVEDNAELFATVGDYVESVLGDTSELFDGLFVELGKYVEDAISTVIPITSLDIEF